MSEDAHASGSSSSDSSSEDMDYHGTSMTDKQARQAVAIRDTLAWVWVVKDGKSEEVPQWNYDDAKRLLGWWRIAS